MQRPKMHHYAKGRKSNATHQTSESITLKTPTCQDVASGTRSIDDFLRGVAHNIRWAPVNREANDEAPVDHDED